MNGTYKHKRLFHRFIRLLVMIGMAISVMSIGQHVMAADFKKGYRVFQTGDYATAIEEWRPLAEAGNIDAQYILGLMNLNGEGIPQDYAKAIKWLHRAAKAGNADAQFSLANMYRKGKGVEQDHAKAITWYRRAAEAGDASAQLNLGVMYGRGQGLPQNYIIAYMWFNLAATQGNQQSVENREIAIKRMTQAQIAEGQRLSRECLARNYKNCAR
jgi:TPR repeat protein